MPARQQRDGAQQHIKTLIGMQPPHGQKLRSAEWRWQISGRDARKIFSEIWQIMYALCRPALRGNAAHQIMRIGDQMITMAKIFQVVIATETPHQNPGALRREARGALHPGHHHIRFEFLQGALHARLGQEIKGAAKGQFYRLQARLAQPGGTFRITPDHRQHLIARVM